MVEPIPPETHNPRADARQRKRIQNRQAQRTYREKLKRRIEDLERWRDVALAYTSKSLGDNSHEMVARCDPAMIIQECDLNHASVYTNEQPSSQLRLSYESLLSRDEAQKDKKTLEESKGLGMVEYDDLHLYSDWCPSIDSGIELSEVTNHFSPSPSDLRPSMDNSNSAELRPTNSSNFDESASFETIEKSASKMISNESNTQTGNESPQRYTSPNTFYPGKSAIHLAAERGQTSVLRLLLNRMPNANLRDGHGRSALHLAVENDHKDTVMLLTTGLASICVDINIQDEAGRSPLHAAISSNNASIVELLLQVPGIELDLYDHEGHTPLHRAITHGSENLVEILVTKGASLTLPIKS